MGKDDFFIGWAEPSTLDRRFFMLAGTGLMLGTGAMAVTLAKGQNPAGPGSWNMGAIRDWHGVVTRHPYPMLRTADIDGTPRTVLIGCQGKCGVAARLDQAVGGVVTIKGSLIARGAHAMIAVVDGADWIRAGGKGAEAGGDGALVDALAFPEIEEIGQVTLRGEILDSKCWFGAMRPSEGKVHKACASLCIRGGIPPAFFAKDTAGHTALMIMTSKDTAHGADLLPLVADPVEVTATVKRRGEMLFLDAPVAQIRRLG